MSRNVLRGGVAVEKQRLKDRIPGLTHRLGELVVGTLDLGRGRIPRELKGRVEVLSSRRRKESEHPLGRPHPVVKAACKHSPFLFLAITLDYMSER